MPDFRPLVPDRGGVSMGSPHTEEGGGMRGFVFGVFGAALAKIVYDRYLADLLSRFSAREIALVVVTLILLCMGRRFRGKSG